MEKIRRLISINRYVVVLVEHAIDPTKIRFVDMVVWSDSPARITLRPEAYIAKLPPTINGNSSPSTYGNLQNDDVVQHNFTENNNNHNTRRNDRYNNRRGGQEGIRRRQERV